MAKAALKRTVRCYLCNRRFETSARTMSTTCPGCNKAIKVEDVIVKSYLPVIDLQTCGAIRVTKRGRIAARRIQCGGDLTCEGTIEGTIESDGMVHLGPKSKWKGKALQGQSLLVDDGATLLGMVTVPYFRKEVKPKTLRKKTTTKKKTTVKKKTTRKRKIAT